jgi:hypothetical protein
MHVVLTQVNHRWGSKLVSQGEITFYSFFVSFMSVFFSGQGCGLMFGFANSEQLRLYNPQSTAQLTPMSRFYQSKLCRQLLLHHA